MGLLFKIASSVPVVGQAKGFYDLAKNITKAQDVESAIIGGVKIILEDCLPPQIKFPVECGLLIVELVGTLFILTAATPAVAVGVAATGPMSVSIVIAAMTRVLMRRL